MTEPHWSTVMKTHAKSFHLASLFFSRDLFKKVKALYALCRWIDDAADTAPNPDEATRRLKEIKEDLHSENPFMEVNRLYKLQQLEVGYIDDLMEGARRDLGEVRLKTEGELVEYGYLVAGSVGLAMADLMGVKAPEARPHAVDLGIAMQITNICRDVKEDAEQGRLYVPESLLTKYGVTPEELLACKVPPAVMRRITEEMLTLADRYYRSAREGYAAIPWRARGPIMIAAELYRGIGVKLLRRGGNPLVGRTWLTMPEKTVCVARALGAWLRSGLFAGSIEKHKRELHHPLSNWDQLRGFAP